MATDYNALLDGAASILSGAEPTELVKKSVETVNATPDAKEYTAEERAELTGIAVKQVHAVPEGLEGAVHDRTMWADWTNLWGPLDLEHLPTTVKGVAALDGYTLQEAGIVLENIVQANVRLNEELITKAIDLRKLQSPRDQALEEEERERLEAEGRASLTQQLQTKAMGQGGNDPSIETAEQRKKKQAHQQAHDSYAAMPGVHCSTDNLDPDHDGDTDMAGQPDADDVSVAVSKSLKTTLLNSLTDGNADAGILAAIDTIVTKAVAELELPTAVDSTMETDPVPDGTAVTESGLPIAAAPMTVVTDDQTIATVTGTLISPPTPQSDPAILDRISKLESALATATDESLRRQQELEEAQEELKEHRKALDEERAVVTKARHDLEDQRKAVDARLHTRLPDPLQYRESVSMPMGERVVADEPFRAKHAIPQTTREYMDRTER